MTQAIALVLAFYITLLRDRLDSAAAQSVTGGLRAGAYYDATPQPEWAMSPLISDTDRIGVTAGAGFRADNDLTADVYALHVNVWDAGFQRKAGHLLGQLAALFDAVAGGAAA